MKAQPATLLDKFAAASRMRAAGADVASLQQRAFAARAGAERNRLRKALQGSVARVIAELKRRSPSAGDLRPEADLKALAREYEAAGAAALSVLTEPEHFAGTLDDLRDVCAAVKLPVLRKDFIVHTAQVYEAAAAGAGAVLLIASILSDQELFTLRCVAEVDLGLDALVEVHTAHEMKRALHTGATLIGVNNRDLATLDVSLDVSRRLARFRQPNLTLVAESGIRTAKDVQRLRQLGYSGMLIGEALLRAASPGDALRALLAEAGP